MCKEQETHERESRMIWLQNPCPLPRLIQIEFHLVPTKHQIWRCIIISFRPKWSAGSEDACVEQREAPSTVLSSLGRNEPTRPWRYLTAYILESINDRHVKFWEDLDQSLKIVLSTFGIEIFLTMRFSASLKFRQCSTDFSA